AQPARVLRIHLKPCARRHALQNRHPPRFRSCVPVLHCSAGVEDEWILAARLLWKRLALNREKLRATIFGWESSIFIQTISAPLNSAFALDHFIFHRAVIAEPPFRNALPFFECIARLIPIRKQFVT